LKRSNEPSGLVLIAKTHLHLIGFLPKGSSSSVQVLFSIKESNSFCMADFQSSAYDEFRASGRFSGIGGNVGIELVRILASAEKADVYCQSVSEYPKRFGGLRILLPLGLASGVES
jgi:hypothetical protein